MIRAYQFKFYFREKDPSSIDTNKKIWETHKTVNNAVREMEEILLLLRQAEYRTDDETLITKEQVQKECLAWARKIQKNNIGKHQLGDDELLATLRKFYEAMIPSAALDSEGNPLSGDSTEINKYVGQMFSAKSKGMMGAFGQILDPAPEWFETAKHDLQKAAEDGRKWLEKEENQRFLKPVGPPPKWLRLFKKGEPSWTTEFIKKQDELRQTVEGGSGVVKKLKENGLLPMRQAFIAGSIDGYGRDTSPWDRMAVKLAARHFLSWESQNHNAKKAHKETTEKLMALEVAIRQENPAQTEKLRAYEAERRDEIRKNIGAENFSFQINERMIRNLEKYADMLSKIDDAEERSKTLDEIFKKKKGEMGDIHLLHFLVKDENADLLKNPEMIRLYAEHNTASQKAKERKEICNFTFTDPQKHPQWVMYEPEDSPGTNYRKFVMDTQKNETKITLPLLKIDGDLLVEEKTEITLSYSKRLKKPLVKNNEISFENKKNIKPSLATLKTSTIKFDREKLENDFREGQQKEIFFDLALDLEPESPKEWFNTMGRPAKFPEFEFFRYPDKNQKLETTGTPLNVISVDFNVRPFASCSIFSLVDNKTSASFSFPVQGAEMKAAHKKSFLVELDGDNPEREARQHREAEFLKLKTLGQKINCLKRLFQLADEQDPEERKKKKTLIKAECAKLNFAMDADHVLDFPEVEADDWQKNVQESHKRLEQVLGLEIGSHIRESKRLETSKNGKFKYKPHRGGKSIWHIRHMENIKKLLKRWHYHTSFTKQNTPQKDDFKKLTDHIKKMKDDRIKNGVNMIITAALENKCRVIVIEDMENYRYSLNRPRRENFLLMTWAHRKIHQMLEANAADQGMHVVNLYPSHFNMYHARTGAPGITVRHEQDETGTHYFADDKGSFFATLEKGAGKEKKLTLVNANINAAQNLQRIFWSRHRQLIKLNCSGDGTTYAPELSGKKAVEELKLAGFNLKGNFYLKAKNDTKFEFKEGKPPKMNKKEKASLFRDPSGIFFPADIFVEKTKFWRTISDEICAHLS